MNLEKSTKLIAKRVKKGFQGYPQISLTYQDTSDDSPSQVIIGFTAEEGDTAQEQTFTSSGSVRTDEFKPPYWKLLSALKQKRY